MKQRRNTTNDQNPKKNHRTLEKAKRKLRRRQDAFSPLSSGGHVCHKPGSMKMR